MVGIVRMVRIIRIRAWALYLHGGLFRKPHLVAILCYAHSYIYPSLEAYYIANLDQYNQHPLTLLLL